MPVSESVPKIVRCAQLRVTNADPCFCGHHIPLNSKEGREFKQETREMHSQFHVAMHSRAKKFEPDTPLEKTMTNNELRAKYHKVVDPLAKWYKGDSKKAPVVAQRTLTMLERTQAPGKSGRPLMEELIQGRYVATSEKPLWERPKELQYPKQWRRTDKFQHPDELGQPEIWSILAGTYHADKERNDAAQLAEYLKAEGNIIRRNMRNIRKFEKRSKSATGDRPSTSPTKLFVPKMYTANRLASPKQKRPATANVDDPNDILGLLSFMATPDANESRMARRNLLRNLQDARSQNPMALSASYKRLAKRQSDSTTGDEPTAIAQPARKQEAGLEDPSTVGDSSGQGKFVAMFKDAVLAKHCSMQKAFRWVDGRSLGKVDLVDLDRTCKFFGVRATKDQLEELLFHLDLDGDGKVVFNEFAKTMNHSALEERDYFQVASRRCSGPCNERVQFESGPPTGTVPSRERARPSTSAGFPPAPAGVDPVLEAAARLGTPTTAHRRAATPGPGAVAGRGSSGVEELPSVAPDVARPKSRSGFMPKDSKRPASRPGSRSGGLSYAVVDAPKMRPLSRAG